VTAPADTARPGPARPPGVSGRQAAVPGCVPGPRHRGRDQAGPPSRVGQASHHSRQYRPSPGFRPVTVTEPARRTALSRVGLRRLTREGCRGGTAVNCRAAGRNQCYIGFVRSAVGVDSRGRPGELGLRSACAGPVVRLVSSPSRAPAGRAGVAGPKCCPSLTGSFRAPWERSEAADRGRSCYVGVAAPVHRAGVVSRIVSSVGADVVDGIWPAVRKGFV
jgi:hypothetical protein